MKSKHYLIILIIFSITYSCKKDLIVKEPKEIIVEGNVMKIQDSTSVIFNHHLTGLASGEDNITWDEQTGIMTVSKNAANELNCNLVENGVIICDLDTTGLLRRIIKLDSTSTYYTITTEVANFEELFSELDIQLSTEESDDVLESSITDHEDISNALTDESGILHPFKIVDYDEDGNVLKLWSAYEPVPDNLHSSVTFDVEYDFSNKTLYENENAKLVMSNGYVKIKNKTSINISVKTSWSGIIPHTYINTFSCSNTSALNTYTQLRLDTYKDFSYNKTTLLKKLYSKKYCYMVGIVPVWITVKADLYSNVNANAAGIVTATYGSGFKNISSSLSLMYKHDDGWSFNKKFSYQFEKEPLKVTGDASATATTEIFPKLEVDLYGIAGPYMEIIPYLTASSHSSFDAVINGEKNYYWNCDLKTGVNSDIGAEVKVLGHSLAKYSHKFTLVSPYTLYYAPAKIEIYSGDGQSGIKGRCLTEKIYTRVLDSWNKNLDLVPVYFEPLSAEDGTPDSHLVFTNSEGLSNTNWTLGENHTQQSLKASIKINGTTVINSVTFKATAN